MLERVFPVLDRWSDRWSGRGSGRWSPALDRRPSALDRRSAPGPDGRSTRDRGPAALRVAPHLSLGDRGEEAAYFHLRRRGCMVVARRWRSSRQPGDLDLVCWEGETLCFVEVKARSRIEVSTAEAAVDADKRRSIRRMARLYLSGLRQPPRQVRFDIISVLFEEEAPGAAPELRLIPNAFGWAEAAYRWS